MLVFVSNSIQSSMANESSQSDRQSVIDMLEMLKKTERKTREDDDYDVEDEKCNRKSNHLR